MRIAVVAVLCVAIFWSLSAVVAVPVTIAIDKSSSIAGPIFRTQPAPQPESRYPDNPTAVVETDCDATNLPQQLQPSTRSPNDANLPQEEEIQPACTNKTATDDESCAQYNDEDGEDFKNNYIMFFSWIPIIFSLMIVLFAYSDLKSFCLSRMKTDSVETLCLQSSDSRYT